MRQPSENLHDYPPPPTHARSHQNPLKGLCQGFGGGNKMQCKHFAENHPNKTVKHSNHPETAGIQQQPQTRTMAPHNPGWLQFRGRTPRRRLSAVPLIWANDKKCKGPNKRPQCDRDTLSVTMNSDAADTFGGSKMVESSFG